MSRHVLVKDKAFYRPPNHLVRPVSQKIRQSVAHKCCAKLFVQQPDTFNGRIHNPSISLVTRFERLGSAPDKVFQVIPVLSQLDSHIIECSRKFRQFFSKGPGKLFAQGDFVRRDLPGPFPDGAERPEEIRPVEEALNGEENCENDKKNGGKLDGEYIGTGIGLGKGNAERDSADHIACLSVEAPFRTIVVGQSFRGILRCAVTSQAGLFHNLSPPQNDEIGFSVNRPYGRLGYEIITLSQLLDKSPFIKVCLVLRASRVDSGILEIVDRRTGRFEKFVDFPNRKGRRHPGMVKVVPGPEGFAPGKNARLHDLREVGVGRVITVQDQPCLRLSFHESLLAHAVIDSDDDYDGCHNKHGSQNKTGKCPELHGPHLVRHPLLPRSCHVCHSCPCWLCHLSLHQPPTARRTILWHHEIITEHCSRDKGQIKVYDSQDGAQ